MIVQVAGTLEYFNTSHVTVYHCPNLAYGQPDKFQYISCYCLSTTHRQIVGLISNFNTSHVTVYPVMVKEFDAVCFISIHLMLLFIEKIPTETLRWLHFNTSHVTVYLTS